ncbi:SUKH-3 domain-containing protein [Acetivibrio clariflavus]|uniref:SUKH-3 domain-containing protein n=1 Tax=Acetivibrio clariflavus TaxID=288965 RepID=UPI0031F526CC
MRETMINQYVKDILIKNGWYSGRKFDATKWFNELADEGYVLHNYAREIIEELGGISVCEQRCGNYSGASFDFNAYYAGIGEFDRIGEYESATKEKLYPIGRMCDSIVYASETGKIYFGDWAELFLCGNSIEEYLNNLFDINYKPIKIDLNRK